MKRFSLLLGILLLFIALFIITPASRADGPPPPPPGGGHGGGGNAPPGGGAPIQDGLPILLLAAATYAGYRAKRIWWKREDKS